MKVSWWAEGVGNVTDDQSPLKAQLRLPGEMPAGQRVIMAGRQVIGISRRYWNMG